MIRQGKNFLDRSFYTSRKITFKKKLIFFEMKKNIMNSLLILNKEQSLWKRKRRFKRNLKQKPETKTWNKNLKQKLETKTWNKNLKQKPETNTWNKYP